MDEMEFPCDEEKMKLQPILHEALKIVSRLAGGSKSRREAVQCGAVLPLVSIASWWATDQFVVQTCCSALDRFCANSRARSQVPFCCVDS